MTVKTRRLDLRVSAEHKRLIERAALATGQAVTSFVLASVLERARETLERESRTVLGTRDRAAFLRLMDDDAPPPAALVRAVKRYRAGHGR